MLELDYTNVLQDAIGTNGLTPQELSQAARSSRPVVERLEAARLSGALGFADLPFDDRALTAVTSFARDHAFPNLLILGIGGSALGPATLDEALQGASGKRLVVLDNIDPGFIHQSLESLNPAETLVNVIAKSGVTAETMASFAIVRKWMVDRTGPSKLRDHFVVTTDPEKGDLLSIAKAENLPVFHIPPNVGGRFSVLSPVGTLPAALLGLDVEALMAGARETALQSRKAFAENPAAVAAFIQWALDRTRKKPILVLFPYVHTLWKFAFWFKQLWGESLGKRMDRQGREVWYGQTPTAALGVTDQHSQLQLFIEGPDDKSFVFWAARRFPQSYSIDHPWSHLDSLAYLQGRSIEELFDAERRATEIALTEAGRPNCTVTVDTVDAKDLGSLIMFSQYMTACAGEFYDINAFDQPGVEYGKKLTFSMMGRPGFEQYRRAIEQHTNKERARVP